MIAPGHTLSPFDPGAPFALVVDDVPAVRMATKALLENNGFVVVTASDGLEAVDAAPLFPFSVILTDLEMPGPDGIETALRIRAMGGPLAGVPIILVSGSVALPDAERMREAGIRAFLPKGGSPIALLREVAAWCGPRRND